MGCLRIRRNAPSMWCVPYTKLETFKWKSFFVSYLCLKKNLGEYLGVQLTFLIPLVKCVTPV